jgi:hypothetical protein
VALAPLVRATGERRGSAREFLGTLPNPLGQGLPFLASDASFAQNACKEVSVDVASVRVRDSNGAPVAFMN